MTYKIYKLINPATNRIFYVGCTTKDLSVRYGGHISSSKKSDYPLYVYMRHLIRKNIKPQIKLICITKHKREEFYQVENLMKTEPLLNNYSVRRSTKGGAFYAAFLKRNKCAHHRKMHLTREHLMWVRGQKAIIKEHEKTFLNEQKKKMK